MFSKAKLKRFNEEVGCAPPPTRYDVKLPSNLPGGKLDKSDRWRDQKEITPGPGTYMGVIASTCTPKRLNSQSSKLNTSSCSSNSASSFISPPKSYFSRSRSFKNSRMKENQDADMILKIKTLQKENNELRHSVNEHKENLSKIQLTYASSMTDGGLSQSSSQGDNTPVETSTAAIQTESFEEATTLMHDQNNAKNPVSVNDEEYELLKDQVDHLTLLRNNLEQSIALKDDVVADLHEQIDAVVTDAQGYQDRAHSLSHEVQIIKDKLQETFDEKVQTETRVKDLIFKYEQMFGERKEEQKQMKDILAQKDIEIELLNDSVSTLNTQVGEYEKAIKRTQNEVSLRLLQISSLEMTVGDLSIATKEREVMETVLEDELKEKNFEMNKLGESLVDVENKIVDVIRDRDQMMAELHAEKEKVGKLTSQLSNYEMKLKEQDVVQQFLEKEVAAREAEISESNSNLLSVQDDLETARSIAMGLQEEAESRLNQIFCLKASLSVKDYDLDSKEDLISSLREEVSLRASEYESVKRPMDAPSTDQIKSLEQQLNQVKDLLCQEEDNTEQLQEKVIELMAEVCDRESEFKKRIIDKDSELEELSVKYSDALLEQEATKRVLACTSEELNNVKLILQASERELEATKSEISKQLKENEDLENSVRGLAVKITHIEDALICEEAEGREVKERYKRKVKTIQENLRRLERENQELVASNTGFKARITHLKIAIEKKSAAVVEMQQCIELLRDEKHQLNNTISIFETRMHDKDTLLTDLQDEFEGKLKFISELQDSMVAKETQVFKLSKQMEDNDRIRFHLEAQLEDQHDKISSLDSLLLKERDEKVIHKVQVTELEEKLQSIEENNEKSFACLKSQIDERVHVVSDLSNEIHNLKAKYEGYEDQLSNLQTSLIEKTSEADRLESTYFELNSKIESQNSSVDELRKENEDLSKESAQLKETLSLKDHKLRKLNQSISETTEQLNKLCKEMEEKEMKEATLDQSLLELNEVLARLGLSDENAEGTSDTILVKAKHEIKRLNEIKVNLESRLKSVDSQNQTEMEELRQLTLALQEESNSWRAKFEFLERMVEPFREQLDTLEVEKLSLLSKTSAAQDEVNKLSYDYAKLLGHQNHRQKIQHIIRIKTENNELREDVQKLRCEVEKLKKVIRRLEERPEKPSLSHSKSKVVCKENKENNANGSTQVATNTPLRSSNRLHRI